MRSRLLPFLAISALLPAGALAAQASPPCNLVDQEALVALKVTSPTQVVDHKDVPDQAGGAPQRVDTCTLAPSLGSYPMIIVSTVSLPAGKHSDPAHSEVSCDRRPQLGMWFALCSAPIKDTVVSLVLLSQGSPDLTTETTFRTQARRLLARESLTAR